MLLSAQIVSEQVPYKRTQSVQGMICS